MKNESKSIVNYDPRSDVVYIVTNKGEEEFIEISPGVNVELDSEGRVIGGIEILNASKALSGIIEPLYRKRQQAG